MVVKTFIVALYFGVLCFTVYWLLVGLGVL